MTNTSSEKTLMTYNSYSSYKFFFFFGGMKVSLQSSSEQCNDIYNYNIFPPILACVNKRRWHMIKASITNLNNECFVVCQMLV
jgi:hypothetical protein